MREATLTKRCSCCTTDKPLEDFSAQANGKLGRHSQCRLCVATKARKRRQENPEAARQAGREYMRRAREKHPERMRDNLNRWRRDASNKEMIDGHKRKSLLKRYNLTIEDYDTMYDNQCSGCAVTGLTSSQDGTRLAVDHDHQTGKIRGLLSAGINKAIGLFYDSPALLRLAADYLEAYENEL